MEVLVFRQLGPQVSVHIILFRKLVYCIFALPNQNRRDFWFSNRSDSRLAVQADANGSVRRFFTY